MLSVLAGIIPAANLSESVMCLHVGRSTKEGGGACISTPFAWALMVTVKDSETAAQVWQKHKQHQLFLNPSMM